MKHLSKEEKEKILVKQFGDFPLRLCFYLVRRKTGEYYIVVGPYKNKKIQKKNIRFASMEIIFLSDRCSTPLGVWDFDTFEEYHMVSEELSRAWVDPVDKQLKIKDKKTERKKIMNKLFSVKQNEDLELLREELVGETMTTLEVDHKLCDLNFTGIITDNFSEILRDGTVAISKREEVVFDNQDSGFVIYFDIVNDQVDDEFDIEICITEIDFL